MQIFAEAQEEIIHNDTDSMIIIFGVGLLFLPLTLVIGVYLVWIIALIQLCQLAYEIFRFLY